ncbi:MAG: DUF4397 domain-containing protein [Anaerotignaceae bacterium]
MNYPDKPLRPLPPEFVPEKSYIRFLHALPNNPLINVEIYVNKRLIFKNFKYQDFTEYLPAKPGSYIIQIYPTGNIKDLLLDMRITLEAYEIATAAVIGTAADVMLEVFSDFPHEIDKSKAFMRFMNLSPDKIPVDIYVDNEPIVYNLAFTEVTEYIEFTPGKHTLKVLLSDTKKVMIDHPNMVLKGGNYYSGYVVGFIQGRPLMEILIPLEGSSYLVF